MKADHVNGSTVELGMELQEASVMGLVPDEDDAHQHCMLVVSHPHSKFVAHVNLCADEAVRLGMGLLACAAGYTRGDMILAEFHADGRLAVRSMVDGDNKLSTHINEKSGRVVSWGDPS